MMLSANNAWRERNPRPTMNFIQKNWKGILVCLVMAVPCWLLGQRFPIVGGPVFGILAGMMVPNEGLKLGTKPSVILMVGVNGVGKTTSIGKLGQKLTAQGKKVLFAAADTFRAAAAEQLTVWAERAGCGIVRLTNTKRPGPRASPSTACIASDCEA